jgi:hypothetical protein
MYRSPRTDSHARRLRCKDVLATFARLRADLVREAKSLGMNTLLDDGLQFRAEIIDHCRERIVFQACLRGQPYANGPAIIRAFGKVEYVDLLLQKEPT